MTDTKKEEGKVEESQAPVVETQAEENAAAAENAEKTEDQDPEIEDNDPEKEDAEELTPEQIEAAEKLEEFKRLIDEGEIKDRLKKGHFKKALEAAEKLEDQETIDKVNELWEEAKAQGNSNPAKKGKAVTLDSVEKDFMKLCSDVDILVKARAKAGKPMKLLFVLKKRLDTALLQYTKFKGASRN